MRPWRYRGEGGGRGGSRRWRLQAAAIALLLCLFSPASAHSQTAPKSSPHPFPLAAALRPQVEFWKKIFATYSQDQVVIHDTRYMNIIYKVVDLRPYRKQGRSNAAIARLKKRQVRQEKERVRAILTKLHKARQKPSKLRPEELRIWNLYSNVNERNKFLRAAAANRLRAQSGLKKRFAKGIQISHRYLGRMEEIFRQQGLPVELTRMPLVESCFNLQAYSKAGAAGIWQFIPSTGKLYLRIDGILDERRDPILSTHAAAKLLRHNYKTLGTWPLAITAYNHGSAGMQRAVKRVKSRDITKIIRRYRSRSFGFASKNFYAEFLAALQVEQQYKKFFGDLPLDPPLRYDEVETKDFVSLKTAARCAGTTKEELLSLNPALSGPIRSGRAYLPKGYYLRIPAGSSPLFAQRYTALPHYEKANEQNPVFITHRVRRNETLGHIARRYSTTVTLLKQLNGITNVRRLQVGQKLRVPTGQKYAALPRLKAPLDHKKAGNQNHKKANKQGQGFITHRVRRNETLGYIAQRYGTTVTLLKQLNGITNARRLQIGQRLRISTNHKSGFITHKVRRNETLGHIARRYSTTVTLLKQLNGITNARRLQIGQRLRVPAS